MAASSSARPTSYDDDDDEEAPELDMSLPATDDSGDIRRILIPREVFVAGDHMRYLIPLHEAMKIVPLMVGQEETYERGQLVRHMLTQWDSLDTTHRWSGPEYRSIPIFYPVPGRPDWYKVTAVLTALPGWKITAAKKIEDRGEYYAECKRDLSAGKGSAEFMRPGVPPLRYDQFLAKLRSDIPLQPAIPGMLLLHDEDPSFPVHVLPRYIADSLAGRTTLKETETIALQKVKHLAETDSPTRKLKCSIPLDILQIGDHFKAYSKIKESVWLCYVPTTLIKTYRREDYFPFVPNKDRLLFIPVFTPSSVAGDYELSKMLVPAPGWTIELSPDGMTYEVFEGPKANHESFFYDDDMFEVALKRQLAPRHVTATQSYVFASARVPDVATFTVVTRPPPPAPEKSKWNITSSFR